MITRDCDALGRVVLPREWRRAQGIGDRQKVPMEIRCERDEVRIRRHFEEICCVCSQTSPDLVQISENRSICTECRNKIQDLTTRKQAKR